MLDCSPGDGCCLYGGFVKDLRQVWLRSYGDRNFPVIDSGAKGVRCVTEQLWKFGMFFECTEHFVSKSVGAFYSSVVMPAVWSGIEQETGFCYK